VRTNKGVIFFLDVMAVFFCFVFSSNRDFSDKITLLNSPIFDLFIYLPIYVVIFDHVRRIHSNQKGEGTVSTQDQKKEQS
jgi:hypothetical protein